MGSNAPEGARTAEVAASLCLATDLGMGLPFEHGFKATARAMRLADLLEVDDEIARETFYVSLLTYSFCTTDVADAIEIFAGHMTDSFMPFAFGSRAEIARGIVAALPPPDATGIEKARQILMRLPKALKGNEPHQRAMCEVGEAISRRLGLPDHIGETFRYLNERWDGKGALKRARADEIPLSLRISLLCHDFAIQQLLGDDEAALTTLAKRGGGAFDPAVVDAFVSNSSDLLSIDAGPEEIWGLVLGLEPVPHVTLEEEGLDTALAVVGDFADLVSPSLSGHSSGVAELAASTAGEVGFDEEHVRLVRRAGWLHDIGRVGVDSRIWEKPDRLSMDETEKVRLHPYHTERILIRSELLGEMVPVASSHHEHLDGSGYHRGAVAATQTRLARLLAVSDTYRAMREPRPHRPPLTPQATAASLNDQAREGILDPEMVAAVLETAGHEHVRMLRPAGLTEREAEVLGLVSRGLLTKQIAASLDLSPKTVDTHIQNCYRKIGVSTRAAATLFAMEHGLVASGELPIDP